MQFLALGFGVLSSKENHIQHYLLVICIFRHFLLLTNKGIGEQIIIKGGARTLIEYMTSSSGEVESSLFLSNLYSPLTEDCESEFGFLCVAVSKSNF